MFLLGSKIGTIIVTHEKRSDGSDFFVMTSDARAKILWTDRTSKTRCEVVFKDGKLVHFLERRHIEGRSADIIANNLKMAYETYC